MKFLEKYNFDKEEIADFLNNSPKKLIDAINSDRYDYITVNFANPDMVGHTGSMEASIKACETIDKNLEKLVKTVLDKDGTIFVTADHGNVEKMFDEKTNQPCTTHTTNKVPFIYISNHSNGIKLNDGALCNIAPTILKEMKIEKPNKMSGESLF